MLEMMVATALMSIAVVGLLSLLSSTLRNARQVKQYDRAAMLARTKMNELLAATPLPLGRPMAGQWDEDSGWTAMAEPFERLVGSAPGSPQLVRVSLEIWWNYGQERRLVQMEGFRRDNIPMEGPR